ncbi:MAG: rRNA maturation RNase YbeY [Lachnospiraceae bacterium]|nr:rRNA maturation RNase YbeY [Lachnospiraceae bacterium]
MTSYVDIDEDIELEFEVEELVNKLLERVCDMEGCPYEACVNIIVTHSDEVRVYNRDYRGIDSSTDVLSFPALELHEGDFDNIKETDADAFDPETGELMLGDIVICIERVYSQAEDFGHSVLREFAFLVTHSLYHLCGYDHMSDTEAGVMEKKQEETLRSLGITRD